MSALDFPTMSVKTGGVAVPDGFDPAPAVARSRPSRSRWPRPRRPASTQSACWSARMAPCRARSGTTERRWRRRGSTGSRDSRSCCRRPAARRWWWWAPARWHRRMPTGCATRPAPSPARQDPAPVSRSSCRRSRASQPSSPGRSPPRACSSRATPTTSSRPSRADRHSSGVTLVGPDDQATGLAAGASAVRCWPAPVRSPATSPTAPRPTSPPRPWPRSRCAWAPRAGSRSRCSTRRRSWSSAAAACSA